MDRGRLLLAFRRTGHGQVHDGLHQITGPVDEELALFRHGVGRAVHQAHHGLLADRRAILAGDDQGTDQVDPIFKIILLGVEVDADEVGVHVGRGHRQAAVALAGDVAQGLGAVLAHGAAETLGPVDQFVEAGADRPGGGDLLHLGFPTWGRNEFGGRACPGRRNEVLERGEGLDRGDADPPHGFLVGAGHVREQGEVFLLGAPLHAEFVVEAAVALEGQACRGSPRTGCRPLAGPSIPCPAPGRAPTGGRLPGRR